MLRLRIITAVVLVAVALLSIYFLSVWYIAAIFGALFALAAIEWSNVMCYSKRSSKIINSILLLAVGCFIFYLTSIHTIKVFLVMYVALVWWVLALFLTAVYPRSQNLLSIKYIGFISGVLTLVPAWIAIVYIFDSIKMGQNWLVLLLLIVWSIDTAGYFIGKKYGNRKLCEKVSPGKTWEGAIAGLVAALLVGAIAYMVNFVEGLTFIKLMLLITITTVFAIVGDLQESVFKRICGLKDSGSLLPGHGGVLDRVDSLTAAAPIFLVFFAILH